MRLIDADALGIGRANEDIFDCPERAKGWNSAIDIIQNAPTVDVVEVVHGHWILHPDFKQYDICSVCGTGCFKRIYDEHSVTVMFYSFCPNCGAKMDGERETDEKVEIE